MIAAPVSKSLETKDSSRHTGTKPKLPNSFVRSSVEQYCGQIVLSGNQTPSWDRILTQPEMDLFPFEENSAEVLTNTTGDVCSSSSLDL